MPVFQNIPDNDMSTALQSKVNAAISSRTPLYIHGGNSKLFYGNKVEATPLDVSKHSGIISYDPTELCITVRSGTLLSDIEKVLDAENQVLPFEPPQYSPTATIGGALAMVRSQGTLGVILEASIRLLPKPKHEITLSFTGDQTTALSYFQSSRIQQLPITASAWFNDEAYLRFSGSDKPLEKIVKDLSNTLSAKPIENSAQFWTDIRDHKHHFFGRTDKPLWRLSLKPASNEITQINDNQLIEWGGAQRWVNTNTPANIIQSSANTRNGYATLFQGNIPETPCFPILDKTLMKFHKQLKDNMDPHGIFNPGRMYSGI